MTIAPFVTSLRIFKLSANQVNIRWDDVGANFYYFVELTETRDDAGEIIPADSLNWSSLGYTADNDWFEENRIQPLTYYKMRVQTTAAGFEPSEWIETEEFQTFEENAYTFEHMQEFNLVNQFIREKFTLNNKAYVDFNTSAMEASLMSESFQFSPEYSDLSSISNFVLGEDEYHEIQGPIEAVCVDNNRTMLGEIDGILYLFERFQHMVKVSNDKGQTWNYVQLFNDRVGNPVARVVIYQNDTTSYVLGYDKLFYGRKSSDVRWSSDEIKFSNNEVTFAKLGDQLKLGFEVEIFGAYATLPGDVSKYAEAFACNKEYLYIVAKDTVRFIKLANAPVDTDPQSPTYGEKMFEDKKLHITGNNKSVVFKMDSIGEKIFALVTGEVKKYGDDPTNPNNVIDSLTKGVYVLQDDGTWKRVFGNTEEERRRIEHGWTSLGTDGRELFFSSANYKDITYIRDQELEDKYPEEISSAVKAESPWQYHSDKHHHMMSFRSNENSGWETFVPGPMRFYAEPWFVWMAREGNRCWITTSDHAAVIYNDITYTKRVDNASQGTTERVLSEVWNKGDATFYCPSVTFDGFIKYASGIMFHEPNGRLIGYYSFDYRVRDNVTLNWKPTDVMFRAYLQNQTRPEVWTPEHVPGLRDPDLRPFITKMMPDSYLLQDSNFEHFCKYYLQFLSDGNGTHYNSLVNLVKNKYPREEYAWEYLWSEIYKRNIYLSKEARDAVVRFFEARKNDFYATKGIEDSYKFLFKLLYNEDVEIDIESKNTTEYDIIVESTNISDDLVGRTVYTASGRSNVTYIEREYKDGRLLWRVTIHNLSGRFIAGQEIKSERSDFEGMIVQGVRGKDMLSNNIDYINRSRSYYVMKIRSQLPTSRYRDDVLRFVHPVGFGFIGITLLTMFINAGLSMKHVETIINRFKNYKWDSGLPSVVPDRNAVLTPSDTIQRDPITDEPMYTPRLGAGTKIEAPANYNSENGNTIIAGQNPDQRRKPLSPTFDQTAVTFANFRELVDLRLKDDAGNPRDPEEPTQVKIDG
ncbi:baseplate wedge protein [Klebsiella phage Metamorpho]|nr:baseplate wedge protein [Klebsiella phage Metamorpho]